MSSESATFINEMPATQFFDMTITEASDGVASGTLPFNTGLCFDRGDNTVMHGAATFALADNVGAAAVISQFDEPEPAVTIDIRIDYLGAATSDLHAEAEVRRFGRYVSVADIVVDDTAGDQVALARGSYRTA
ncbi:MAG: PaaI family thioesterase [Salinirussus sp.]